MRLDQHQQVLLPVPQVHAKPLQAAVLVVSAPFGTVGGLDHMRVIVSLDLAPQGTNSVDTMHSGLFTIPQGGIGQFLQKITTQIFQNPF